MHVTAASHTKTQADRLTDIQAGAPSGQQDRYVYLTEHGPRTRRRLTAAWVLINRALRESHTMDRDEDEVRMRVTESLITSFQQQQQQQRECRDRDEVPLCHRVCVAVCSKHMTLVYCSDQPHAGRERLMFLPSNFLLVGLGPQSGGMNWPPWRFVARARGERGLPC